MNISSDVYKVWSPALAQSISEVTQGREMYHQANPGVPNQGQRHVCVSRTPHGAPERGIPGDFCKMPRPVGLGMTLGQTESALGGRDRLGEEPRGRRPHQSAHGAINYKKGHGPRPEKKEALCLYHMWTWASHGILAWLSGVFASSSLAVSFLDLPGPQFPHLCPGEREGHRASSAF